MWVTVTGQKLSGRLITLVIQNYHRKKF